MHRSARLPLLVAVATLMSLSFTAADTDPGPGFVGCYNGATPLFGIDTPADNLDACKSLCQSKQAKFAAIRNSDGLNLLGVTGRCSCGDSIPPAAAKDPGNSVCASLCKSTTTGTCGGKSSDAVFDLSAAGPATASPSPTASTSSGTTATTTASGTPTTKPTAVTTVIGGTSQTVQPTGAPNTSLVPDNPNIVVDTRIWIIVGTIAGGIFFVPLIVMSCVRWNRRREESQAFDSSYYSTNKRLQPVTNYLDEPRSRHEPTSPALNSPALRPNNSTNYHSRRMQPQSPVLSAMGNTAYPPGGRSNNAYLTRSGSDVSHTSFQQPPQSPAPHHHQQHLQDLYPPRSAVPYAPAPYANQLPQQDFGDYPDYPAYEEFAVSTPTYPQQRYSDGTADDVANHSRPLQLMSPTLHPQDSQTHPHNNRWS